MTQYTHIRNATGKLTIKNTTFLIDPFLAPKDTYPGFEDSIIMGTKDIGRMVVRKPEAKIIAVHMDTVNHTTTSRKDVHKFIKGTHIETHVAVPEDGETIVL